MQIIFIDDYQNYYDTMCIKPIYVLNPMKLSNKNKIKFNKYILCSHVIKIIHGSDSLDYPHIYKSMIRDKFDFIQFINKTVDTRFLCEISKRIMHRLGILDIFNIKCSIYNALLDHMVINQDTFESLTTNASKINYNKDWIVGNLTQTQLVYVAHDVVHLYDLLDSINDSIHGPIHILSLINRLYRFHIINKFNFTDISDKCRQYVISKKLRKSTISSIDKKIMEINMFVLEYKSKSNNHTINIYIEDIMSISTIKKTIMNCLRAYYIAWNTDYIKTLDVMFTHPDVSESMLSMIHLVKQHKKNTDSTL